MGGSSVAWLDTSPDDQRRVREMLALFDQQESRDEIGVAQIRDALSNTLFPGVSVLQTRARYYLFVPWCFALAAKNTADPEQVLQRADRLQRGLGVTLAQTPGIGDGVIGARAGAAVKILPHTIFWNGLIHFGVLRRDVAPNRLVTRVLGSDADELASRTVGDWHPTVPPPPAAFPTEVPGGFTLTADEASWLRERFVDGSPGTLLAQLAGGTAAPDERSAAPWEDSAVAAVVDDSTREGLHHARRFSFLVLGATTVYNLLVARAYLEAGFNSATTSTERYEHAVTDWLGALHDDPQLLADWDLDALWALVRQQNPRLDPRTQHFVTQWLRLARSPEIDAAAVPGSAAARLVAARERSLKRAQSRLDNHKLLALWNGAAMAGRLTYRWPQVRQIMRDVHAGLAEGVAGAGA